MKPINQRIFDEAIKKINDACKRHSTEAFSKGKICNLCHKSHWDYVKNRLDLVGSLECIEKHFKKRNG